MGHPRTRQVFLVLARFAAYAATLYAIHATDWAHLAVAAIALALLPVVYCRNHPPVWWPRELLIAYLATLAALQISGARWQLTAVAFSCTVWWTWPRPPRSWRHPQPRSRGRIA